MGGSSPVFELDKSAQKYMCHPQMGSHPESKSFPFPQDGQQNAEKEKTEDRCSHKGISPEV